ncbi:MAG: XylR N-terminal domain-containing protein [Rhodocyclaceae bacterium]|nr:XylR N-terminal domain-containing protein [Rhodocyclaceae bacterium]MBK6553717.1 XylR N-terminal domain-containing protein [Rhodocyclaceae bacterium]MBK9311004.1 XylR N-terminal domain-containing protein [Rhodocyclaceae bacterium]MBK9953880.1 XylR N-terminal domain-containing protein [Rhodocyclaceae bacterium]
MRPRELEFFSLFDAKPNQGLIEWCGRRAILIHTNAMGALRKELVQALGVDMAKVILTRYGYSCGHDDAALLQTFMNPDSIEDFALGGPRVHAFSGIAEVEPHIVEVDRERSHYLMSGFWRNSYEAEQHLRLFGPAEDAVCWTLAGYASGFASYVFGVDMICIESECQGRGDDHCAWTLKNADESSPQLLSLKKYFQPLNIKAQINLLESRVNERTLELEASEQRYRDLIEDLPEIVFALHATGHLIQLNKAGRQRMGVGVDDVPRLRIKDMVRPDFRDRAIGFLRETLTTAATTKLDVIMRDAEGQDFPVQLQLKPVLKDGKVVGYSGLAVDVAAHREREQRLVEYASRLEHREQQIQDILNDAVYMLDLDGRFTFVNARMAGLLRVPALSVVGRRCEDVLAGAAARRLRKDFDRRLAGKSALPFEIALSGENTKYLLEINSALLSEGGTPVGVIGVARDITARREMEKQLARANRLTALGQFASGIAHEINNPLGLVSGFAEELQCILERLPAADGATDIESLRRGLTTIQDQVQRCKHITENLLLFSRKQAVPLEPLDLAALVREQLATHADSGLMRGIAIELVAQADLPPVLGNPALFDQVLLNLLKNARDAMDNHGKIVVAIRRSGHFVAVEIADEGPGIPLDIVDHVFDPFFTTKPPGRGTGLGLSICYGLMADLRGRISCGNRPERGAWFRVELPLDEPVAEAGKP